MRVQLLTRMAGPKGNKAPGSVIDVSPDEAKALVGGGYATYICARPPHGGAIAETAAIEPDTEKAVRRNPRKRKKARRGK